MAYSLIASGKGAAESTPTTAAIDTTGADFIVVGVALDNAATPSVTDSKGNSWTEHTSYTQGNARVRLYSCIPTSVGTAHTFTANQTFIYGAIFVAAFSGGKQTSPYDQQNGANGFVSSLATGSITPSEDNELLISLFAGNGASSPVSIDNGFTETDETDFSSGVNYAGAMAYKIQTTATAINPTWTRTNTNGTAVTIASFKAEPAATGNDAAFFSVL